MNNNVYQTLYDVLMNRAEKCIDNHKEHFQNEEYKEALYWATQLAEAIEALEWVSERYEEAKSKHTGQEE
jgi:hypothetical protein